MLVHPQSFLHIALRKGARWQVNAPGAQQAFHAPWVHGPAVGASRNEQLLLYKLMISRVYSKAMDIAISDLRAHLSEWLERARGGAEIVITDRGVPVARLLGVTTTAALEAARAPAASRDRQRSAALIRWPWSISTPVLS
jgi:prevent-host-death family protein